MQVFQPSHLPTRHSARSGATLILLFALPLLAGCLETEQNVVLNPDGSGKMTVHIIQPDVLARFGGDERGSKAEREQQKVQQFLAPVLNSTGIDAWSNVTFKTLEDGRIEFRGTGYFRSINDVKIEGNGGIPLRMERSGENATVWLRPEPRSGENDPEADSARAAMSDAQLAVIADSMRTAYQATRPMVAEILNGFRESVTLSLPSRVTRNTGWQLDASGRSARFTIDGARLLSTLDSITDNNAFWQQQARNGNQAPSDLVGRILGADSLLVQFPASSGPQFNYAKEVAAARKETAAIRKKYKLAENR